MNTNVTTYEYKGCHYQIYKLCKIKQKDGTWVDGIAYDSLKTNETFAREASDFYNKFQRVVTTC